MKKATIYARVSSEGQKKDRTIESQIAALKKQVADAGDVLVKEYIDDGYSGARLDRPALDQLRKDLKTPLFETVYFLNADRIARDASYQTIIISELLKNRKQIIIGGKDYVHNPENKFSLTVLGAVAELERAKIVERASRGRAMRLAQGQLVGGGHNTFGYDYARRGPGTSPRLIVNRKEAAAVRFIFTEYAKGKGGMFQITRKLEGMGLPTKAGKKLWRTSNLKKILRNETYIGTKYFNTIRRVREYANPLFGIKHSTSKIVKRDRSEWVGVKVPPIVPLALFDKVRARLEWNRKRYRNPKQPRLLTALVRCGACGGSVFCYRRYYTKNRLDGTKHVIHRSAYRCNWRHRQGAHAKTADISRCSNPQINAEYLESTVLGMIEATMFSPKRIRDCMDFFKEKGRKAQLVLEAKLKAIEREIVGLDREKKRIIDVYASGDLTREEYVKRNMKYDDSANDLRRQRTALAARIPLLHKTEVIDAAIAEYCETARAGYEMSGAPDSRRQFMIDRVEKVVILDDRVTLYGSVPVGAKGGSDGARMEYKIDGRVVRPSIRR